MPRGKFMTLNAVSKEDRSGHPYNMVAGFQGQGDRERERVREARSVYVWKREWEIQAESGFHKLAFSNLSLEVSGIPLTTFYSLELIRKSCLIFKKRGVKLYCFDDKSVNKFCGQVIKPSQRQYYF